MIIDFGKYNNKENKKPIFCLVRRFAIRTWIEQQKPRVSKASTSHTTTFSLTNVE